MNELPGRKTVWTIRDILNWTAGYLKTKGCDTPRLDAELLLAHNLGIERIRLYLDFDRPLTDEERVRFRGLVRRRAVREPVALIIGKKEFWSMDVEISPGVLIPRPETEILVQVVLEECRDHERPSVLELGCGSGGPLMAICSVRPDIQMFASDISPEAIRCAANNVSNLSLSNPIHFWVADLLDCVREGQIFDVIYSNPPYIPSEDIVGLSPEICDFEPRTALDGGPDGLDIIRRLIPGARDRLKEGGRLIMEIGDRQFDAVAALLRKSSFSVIQIHNDLSGKNRVVRAEI